jgi:hypothetical protein
MVDIFYSGITDINDRFNDSDLPFSKNSQCESGSIITV